MSTHAAATFISAPSSQREPLTTTPGKAKLWTGRVLSGLALAFLFVDLGMKLLQLPVAVEGTTALGYAAHSVFTIGLIQLACVLLYAVPRTAALGAILLTGYLGGAVATHLRLENPLFSHTLFPLYVAALIWGGLYLRDARLSVLLPFGTKRAD